MFWQGLDSKQYTNKKKKEVGCEAMNAKYDTMHGPYPHSFPNGRLPCVAIEAIIHFMLPQDSLIERIIANA
jgi:hypothetical protein